MVLLAGAAGAAGWLAGWLAGAAGAAGAACLLWVGAAQAEGDARDVGRETNDRAALLPCC